MLSALLRALLGLGVLFALVVTLVACDSTDTNPDPDDDEQPEATFFVNLRVDGEAFQFRDGVDTGVLGGARLGAAVQPFNTGSVNARFIVVTAVAINGTTNETNALVFSAVVDDGGNPISDEFGLNQMHYIECEGGIIGDTCEREEDGTTWSREDGAFSLQFTEISDTEVRGTFGGTLINEVDSNDSVQLSDGTFTVEIGS